MWGESSHTWQGLSRSIQSRAVRETLRALRDVLRNPALRRLQVAWAASMTGNVAYLVTLSVVAYRHGGGATGVGLLMLLRMAASAVFSPFTAIVADRASRRRVMITTDLVRALLVLLLAWEVRDSASVAVLFATACLIAVVATAFRPAQASLLPALARTPEQLTAANAVAVTIESAAIFAGPGIGGLLLAVTGPGTVFGVCAAVFLWSAALIVLVPEPARMPVPPGEGEAEHGDSLIGTVTAGFHALVATPLLATVVGVYALQAVAAGALAVFTVVLALQQLHLGNAGVGYLDSAFGVGGILGGVGAAGLAAGRRLALAFSVGVLVWGFGIALVGLSDSTLVVVVLLAGIGAGNTIVDVAAITLLQRSAPAHVIGRVFGVLESIMLAAIGLGSIGAPALIALVGVRPTIVATGLVLPVAVALTGRWLVRLDHVAPVTAAHIRLLREIVVFAPLALPALEGIAAHLRPVQVGEGATVVREGDPGDDFYIVEEGSLAVMVGGEPRAPIHAGGFFGEIALLRDTPRTATVTATSDCRLLALGREQFLAAVTGHAESAAAADLVVSRRLGGLRQAVSPI
jgi:Major Facilitator Superfamily/Cyclic nucleotide-binding domain